MSNQKFAGVGTALITPLTADGELDHAALGKLVARVGEGGADYLVCGGTSGEGPFVRRRVRHEMIASVVEFVAGERPVVAGVITDSLETARGELGALGDSGIDGVMVTPPYYYPLDDDQLLTYYKEVAAASPVPVILYNIPAYARNALSPALVSRLTEIERIVAVKDSGARDFGLHAELIRAARHRADFAVLIGLDKLLLPSLVMGGHGLISPSGNVFPDLAPSVLAAYRDGDLAAARRQQETLVAAINSVEVGRFPGWWKAAVQGSGIGSAVASPLAPQPAAGDAVAISCRMESALRAGAETQR
ncbi:dihydrodipicolinate synthase family protein [Dactylosporangium sp. CA-233914]|uniref:dihydrodipicolinate synthase family protein n=1 Tax=Dactylosporangium sp. CA-233914 TaxID=3239934 RepID=UPI003D8A91C7